MTGTPQGVGVRWRLPDPAPIPPSGIHAFVWNAWPWVNWLLPVFFCFHGWLGSGGWETLFLTVLSPVIIPVFGLLASVPRFILRKRGHTTAPGPVVWLLFLNGWSWFVAPLTIPGPTDGQPHPSLLQSLVGLPLSDGYQGAMLIGCVILGTLCWVAVVILAGILAPQSDPSGRKWRIISWISAFVIPTLFVVVSIIGVHVTAGRLDAASETSGQVASRSIPDQIELAEERHEQTQRSVSAVRALIADDGWEIQGGLNGLSYECRSLHVECYFIDFDFLHETGGTGLDRDALIAQIESLGWTAAETGGLVDAEGRELRINISEEGAVRLEVQTPWWWGDSFDLLESLTDSGTRPDSFAADEWPKL